MPATSTSGAATTLLCEGELDLEPVKIEHWSQDKLCPSRHAEFDKRRAGAGFLILRAASRFKKNNTLYFSSTPRRRPSPA